MRFYELLNDSYSDDTGKSGSKIISPDFSLEIGEFAKESGQLVATFPIQYEDIVDVVRDYTKESPLNAVLISGKKLSSKQQDQYDILMTLKDSHCKLHEEHHVYSGASVFDPSSAITNGTFETPAFISTSLNIEVAAKNNNFHRSEKNTEIDHILHFILPKNYSGCFYIGPYSTSPEELEMLIFPNEKFKLISSKIKEIGKITRHIHTFHPVT